MTQPPPAPALPELTDADHLRLIQLAASALRARDDRFLWKGSVTEAAEAHGAACDALWQELERQVVISEGSIPTLDHPSVKVRKMAARLRSEIIATVQDAVMAALGEIEHGPALEDDDE